MGIKGSCWAETYLEVRALAGLHADTDGLLMPAPLAGGGWSRRALDAWEASLWLRECLVAGGADPCEVAAYTSHSLKVTALDWSAKAGVSKPLRRILGGHIKPKDRSVFDYTRDGLAEPLKQLNEVVDQISLGEFIPDGPRSGRWPGGKSRRTKQQASAGGCDLPEVATIPGEPRSSEPSMTKPECSDDEAPGPSSPASLPTEPRRELAEEGSETESAGSESDESSGTEADPLEVNEAGEAVASTPIAAEDLAAERVAGSGAVCGPEAPAEKIPQDGLYKHVSRQTLHVGCETARGERRLLCFRKVGDDTNFRELLEWPAFDWPRCDTCFSKWFAAGKP